MAENGSLTVRQRRFVLALLESPTVREAAQVAGVGETTAWRYLSEDSVRAELARRTDGLLTQAASGLLSDMAEARATLLGVMRSATAGDGAKVSAARAVLDAGLRLFELYSLADRMAAVEQRIEVMDAKR